MIHPDDPSRQHMTRWNTLVRVLLADPSVKHVARAAADYADYDTGASCHPTNERLMRETGYSDRAVRTAWAVLRDLAMARRVRRGVPHRGIADEYVLTIPPNWDGLPILGPHRDKFECLNCGNGFNPQGNCVLRKDGSVGFRVQQFVFCPPPRRRKGRTVESCVVAWNRARGERGERQWNDLGPDVWKLFRQARGDDW